MKVKLAIIGIIILMVAACQPDPLTRPKKLRVMTMNLYLGADLDPLVTVAETSPSLLPQAVASTYQSIINSNFIERAKSIAKIIQRENPHVIGLQEVTLIRIQSPGDAISGGTTLATTEVYNYLNILLGELNNLGLNYRMAGFVQNGDVETAMEVSSIPLLYDDFRFTDFDVILVKDGVEVSNVVTKNYLARREIVSAGIGIPRGYVAMDLTIGQYSFTVINTHLESGISASSSGLRRDQAYELIEDTSVMSKPLILLGDLNSPAPGGVVYNALLSSGFTDAWQGGSPSNTCCQNPDLLNPTSQLFERIDFILYKPQYHTAIRRIDSYISGFDPGDKTVSGLWPSDHASVVFIFDLYR